MATKKTLPVAKGHTHSKKKEAGIQKNLVIARGIMEHTVNGFCIIAKITDEKGGFKMEGGVVNNGIEGIRVAQVVLNTLDLSPVDFIFAGATKPPKDGKKKPAKKAAKKK